MKLTPAQQKHFESHLRSLRSGPELKALLELLALRRQAWRDTLVKAQPNLVPLVQGRAQEADELSELLQELTK